MKKNFAFVLLFFYCSLNVQSQNNHLKMYEAVCSKIASDRNVHNSLKENLGIPINRWKSNNLLRFYVYDSVINMPNIFEMVGIEADTNLLFKQNEIFNDLKINKFSSDSLNSVISVRFSKIYGAYVACKIKWIDVPLYRKKFRQNIIKENWSSMMSKYSLYCLFTFDNDKIVAFSCSRFR